MSPRERPIYHYPSCRFRYECDGPQCPSCNVLDAKLKHGTIWPQLAADAIIEDLKDRHGLKWEWNKIDEGIKMEIRETWVNIIREAAKP